MSNRGGRGSPRPEGKAVIQIHSSFMSQRELSAKLERGCEGGTFQVEVRHNLYTIYLNHADLDKLDQDLKSQIPDCGRLERTHVLRGPNERRGSRDSVSESSDWDGAS